MKLIGKTSYKNRNELSVESVEQGKEVWERAGGRVSGRQLREKSQGRKKADDVYRKTAYRESERIGRESSERKDDSS